jgi:hypothetical protein
MSKTGRVWIVLGMALALLSAVMVATAQQPEATCCARQESAAPAYYRLHEFAPGQRIQIREVTSPADPQLASSLQVLVLNQQGLPAANAEVQAFHATLGYLYSSDKTGADGRATLNVPDGQWKVSASSYTDHFVVWRENVTAPGSVTLDTQGTVPVTAIARGMNGQPLIGADVSFERFHGYNQIGITDAAGRARADLLPGGYCAAAASWGQNLYLSQLGVAVSGPVTVTRRRWAWRK